MWFSVSGRTAALAAMAIPVLAPQAFGAKLLSQISVRHAHAPERVYGEVHRFPEGTRDYSPATLDGWSFRHELPGGAVREVQIARIGSASPYLIATDLFANGRFSTMSHTVLFLFPRTERETWRVLEHPSGDVHVGAPDGTTLVIDGRSGALRANDDFRLAPIGAAGTPPRLWHRGFHVRIESVGRSPFLRGTIARVEHPDGTICRLRTDEIFRYEDGPESDRLRFDTDDAFFSYLAGRCPGFAPARPLLQEASAPEPPEAGILVPVATATGTAAAVPVPVAVAGDPVPVPILVPASTTGARVSPRTRWRTNGGLLWQLFSY